MRVSREKNTMAATATGWRKLIGPTLVVSLIAFLFVLFVPLLTTRVSFISYNEIVMVRVAYDLFLFDKFLFVIIFVFGMLFPIIKMTFSILCWYSFDSSYAESFNRKLAVLGKLSMLDVILLALFIIAFKGVGIGTVQIRHGLYLYAAIVIGSLFLNLAMDINSEKLRGPDRPLRSS
jgi:paraquat-inducible protein A